MSRLRVLYVDDDPGLARLVSRALERRGYDVVHAETGEAGLALVGQGGIDVVALDHYLPTGTGLDVLTALGHGAGVPPVIYVTGSAETAIAVAALKAGAADYVPKLVSEEFFELLGSAVDQAVETSRLQREKERAEQEVREARDRAELLLAEVNHRVANSLSLVAALVRMQAHAVSEPSARDALAETEARIAAIAGVHRRLYTSSDVRGVDMAEYLGALVSEIEGSMQSAGKTAEVKLESEAVQIPTDKAVSLGVILTELVTNAIKYAYPDGGDGQVRIAFRGVGDGQARLSVADDGIGYAGEGPAKGTGLGSRIVRAMAVTLGSEVRYGRPAAGGTEVTVEFAI